MNTMLRKIKKKKNLSLFEHQSEFYWLVKISEMSDDWVNSNSEFMIPFQVTEIFKLLSSLCAGVIFFLRMLFWKSDSSELSHLI